MSDSLPGSAKADYADGRLPREEEQASFYGITLTNKRVVVELPEYVHSVDVELVSEMALSVIPFWQRIEAQWGFLVRGTLLSLVPPAFAAAAVALTVPSERLAWLLVLVLAASTMALPVCVALFRVATAPTCIVNVATQHGVAGYPIRIPFSELPAAKRRFRELLARATALREDPSLRRTLGFAGVERRT